MVVATTSSSVPSKEPDWADISDDEEDLPTPVVKLDGLDLNSLSLQDKSDSKGKVVLIDPGLSLETTPAPTKSLADRISSADAPNEKKEEEEKDKTNGTSKPEEKDVDKEEKDTNLIQNKYEVAVKLQDLQADPNSPLYSVKSFEELGL